jgi:outer membrane protein insertion porin family
VLTLGARAEDLPFDRRFFPGGENSIRGYQEGEASPRDFNGQLIGAETYILGNVEFEQALTRAFSLVLFSDSIGFARDLSDYPANETLYSAGGGLRWKTIVGPIRLEYGHNLNPRPGDPSGTIHFSMGFPF